MRILLILLADVLLRPRRRMVRFVLRAAALVFTMIIGITTAGLIKNRQSPPPIVTPPVVQTALMTVQISLPSSLTAPVAEVNDQDQIDCSVIERRVQELHDSAQLADLMVQAVQQHNEPVFECINEAANTDRALRPIFWLAGGRGDKKLLARLLHEKDPSETLDAQKKDKAYGVRAQAVIYVAKLTDQAALVDCYDRCCKYYHPDEAVVSVDANGIQAAIIDLLYENFMGSGDGASVTEAIKVAVCNESVAMLRYATASQWAYEEINDLGDSPRLVMALELCNRADEKSLRRLFTVFSEADIAQLLWKIAAIENDKKCMKWLLSIGIDPDVRDKEGRTTLMVCPDADITAMLITAGADVNARDNKGVSVIEHAREALGPFVIEVIEKALKEK